MVEPRPEPLILAEGVRFPRDDEFPAGYEEERRRLAQARITTGYRAIEQTDPGFSTLFEANVHAPDLWDTFHELALAILPEIAAPIVGMKDEEPILGPYTARDSALKVLARYRHPLVQDGLLEFGLIHQRAGSTEEVFVRSVKYVQIWTNRPHAVRAVLARRRIPEMPDVQFVDEYPRVSETLRDENGEAGWFTVLEKLRADFERLPRPQPDP